MCNPIPISLPCMSCSALLTLTADVATIVVCHSPWQHNLYMCCTRCRWTQPPVWQPHSESTTHCYQDCCLSSPFPLHCCIFLPYYFLLYISLFAFSCNHYVACNVVCDAGGGPDQLRQLGAVDVHDAGSGVQGNHHRPVLHQRLHLHQQLCAQCQEGESALCDTWQPPLHFPFLSGCVQLALNAVIRS